jgi:hypothetical protein
MARTIHYSGWYRRLDYLSPQERYAMDMQEKQTVNPFRVGDRVETLDSFGRPIETGLYVGSTYVRYGALKIFIRLDNGVTMSAYYPRGIRKEQKALAIIEPQCTSLALYQPRASNIIPFEQAIISIEKEKAA